MFPSFNKNPKKNEQLTTAEIIELMENDLQSFIFKNKDYIEKIVTE